MEMRKMDAVQLGKQREIEDMKIWKLWDDQVMAYRALAKHGADQLDNR
jgi:hypothetical protein